MLIAGMPLKWGEGRGINEERLRVRAPVGERAVVSGGAYALAVRHPKNPQLQLVNPPHPSWKLTQRIYRRAPGLAPASERLSGGYASEPRSLGLKGCNYPQLDRLSRSRAIEAKDPFGSLGPPPAPPARVQIRPAAAERWQ